MLCTQYSHSINHTHTQIRDGKQRIYFLILAVAVQYRQLDMPATWSILANTYRFEDRFLHARA